MCTVGSILSSTSADQVMCNNVLSRAKPTAASSVQSQDTITPLPAEVQDYRSIALIRESSAFELSDDSQSSQPPSVNSSQSGDNSSASSQQLSYLEFECGCGQCTVYSFVSGKVCPNPKKLPFPKLEGPQILPEDIEYLEREFSQQSKLMHHKFCRLVIDTFDKIEERSVKVSDVIHYLRLRFKFKWYLQIEILVQQDVDTFENIETFHQLSEYLMDKNYCSWFDYDLIEHIRESYLFPSATSEDKTLSDYKEHFRSYVSQRCFTYLHDTGPLPSNQVKIKCKLDCEYNKICQKLIKHLKYVIAKIIGAPAYHLAFKTAKEGCTELIFGAPSYFSEIKRLSKYQISQLKKHGFIDVTISGQNLLHTPGNLLILICMQPHNGLLLQQNSVILYLQLLMMRMMRLIAEI